MSDVWSHVSNLDEGMQEQLAKVLETRGADAEQQRMRHDFLGEVGFPEASRVLEIGCGTGVLTRKLARWPGVENVVGVDPAASLLSHARALAADLPNVSFVEADGRALPVPDSSFDVVIFDSTLSHLPEAEKALAEAVRALSPSGRLGIFEGDYATATVALSDRDALQIAVDTMMANSVHDRWIVRRLPRLVRESGFEDIRFRSLGYAEFGGGYLLTVVDRGIAILRGANQISESLSDALRAEVRYRLNAGTFYGHIAYATVTATKR